MSNNRGLYRVLAFVMALLVFIFASPGAFAQPPTPAGQSTPAAKPASVQATDYPLYGDKENHTGSSTTVFATTDATNNSSHDYGWDFEDTNSRDTTLIAHGALIGVEGGGSNTGVYGDGSNYGVVGSSSYTGVYGYGSNYGVVGSGDTYGVYGVSGAYSGTSYGVRGEVNSSSTASYGGYFTATAGVGIYGSSNANGVEGHGYTGVTGYGGTYGVDAEGGAYGLHAYGDSIGVYSYGGAYGVQGFTDSASAASAGGAFTGTMGSGVYAHSSSNYGLNATSTSSYGVYARSTNSYGVYARSDNSYGMYGVSTNSSAIYGYSTSGNGNYGNAVSGTGVKGNSGSGVGVAASTATGKIALRAYNANKSAGYYAGYFDGNVYIAGSYVATGTKSAMVFTDQGSRLMYADESTQNYFSDQGTAMLKNGDAVITIDPLFAQTVNLSTDYQVFTSPWSASSVGLAVINRTATSFEVRELSKGAGNYKFDWRITALRKGYEKQRMDQAPSSITLDKGFLDAPETVIK